VSLFLEYFYQQKRSSGMNATIWKTKGMTRLLGPIVVFATALAFWGCPVLIPVVIYKQSTKHHTATVQVNKKADDVYGTAIQLLEDNPEIKVLEKDDEKRAVEAEKGELFASVSATPIDGGKTQLVVTADAGKREEDKELALKIVTKICDALGVKYTLVED
jgi:hypothetical protein